VIALAAIVAGILIADMLGTPAWLFFVIVISIFPLAIVFYFKRKPIHTSVLGLLCLLLLAGFEYSFRYNTFPPKHVVHYADSGKVYRIFGTIDDWPVVREHRTSLYCTVDSIASGNDINPCLGRIVVSIGVETTRLQYGDRIYFESKLYTIKGGKNPSGLDFKRYLNLKTVFAAAYLPHHFSIQVDPLERRHYLRVIDDLRDAILNTFRLTLEPDAAALASGFLIGETREIPSEIYNYFRDSGTLHLLAVSGSNVGLVVLLFVFLLRASPLGVGRKTILLLFIVLLFCFLSNNQPSVVRASVMAGLVLLGHTLQRKIDLNNIIAAAAMIILIVQPTQLFDIGFQLSFATAWGLIFITPRIMLLFKAVQKRWYYKYIIFPFIISFVAQIVAMPIVAFYFQRFPAISFIANLIIVPLVSMIVIGEMILLLASLIYPLFGSFVGSLLNPLFLLTIDLLEQFGTGSMRMMINYQIPSIIILTYLTAVVLITLSISMKKARRTLIFFLLATVNYLLIAAVFHNRYDYKLTVFSTPGGIVSVNELSETQLVMSNLPLKDYLICENIIESYLRGKNIKKFDIIVLSSQYQDIKEAAFMSSIYDSNKLYIPLGGANLLADLNRAYNSNINLNNVYQYTDYPLKKIHDERRAYLSEGILWYRLDSLNIFFIANDISINLEFLDHDSLRNPVIIVKDRVTNSDLKAVIRQNIAPSDIIICNRINRIDHETGSILSQLRGNDTQLIEISRVGAVEILINAGRLCRIK
jgi:ComEC/Rec2-related protein